MGNEHREELKEFIRQHRNNESNFEVLLQKLGEEISNSGKDAEYIQTLKEIKSKQAEQYSTAKEKGGSTWPEFENFVSAFEKAIV